MSLFKANVPNSISGSFYEVDPSFKALTIISLSGGLRITERLKLKKKDFLEEDGILYIRVQVLKKKRDEKRWARIHPVATPFIKDYIKHLIGAIVKMSQPTAYRKTRRYFKFDGVCNHSLRHSNISYMLFEEDMNHLKLSKLLHIDVNTIAHYAHLNERKTLKAIFTD